MVDNGVHGIPNYTPNPTQAPAHCWQALRASYTNMYKHFPLCQWHATEGSQYFFSYLTLRARSAGKDGGNRAFVSATGSSSKLK